jgi:phosphopantetheinyl transferase
MYADKNTSKTAFWKIWTTKESSVKYHEETIANLDKRDGQKLPAPGFEDIGHNYLLTASMRQEDRKTMEHLQIQQHTTFTDCKSS